LRQPYLQLTHAATAYRTAETGHCRLADAGTTREITVAGVNGVVHIGKHSRRHALFRRAEGRADLPDDRNDVVGCKAITARGVAI
jgi:hypothetical protein